MAWIFFLTMLFTQEFHTPSEKYAQKSLHEKWTGNTMKMISSFSRFWPPRARRFFHLKPPFDKTREIVPEDLSYCPPKVPTQETPGICRRVWDFQWHKSTVSRSYANLFVLKSFSIYRLSRSVPRKFLLTRRRSSFCLPLCLSPPPCLYTQK